MSSRSTPDVAEKHAETNTLSIDDPVAPTSTGPYTAAEEDAVASERVSPTAPPASAPRPQPQSSPLGGTQCTGKVLKWITKHGYGFIQPDANPNGFDGGGAVFCHCSEIADGNMLAIGATVVFETRFSDERKQFQAKHVTGGFHVAHLAMPPRPPDGQSFKAYFRGPFRRDLKSLRSVEPTRPRIFGAVFFGGQSWEKAEGDLAAIEIAFRPHFVLSLFMVIITEQCLHARFPAAHRVWRASTGFPLFGWSGFGVQNENPFHILHAPAVVGLVDAAAAVALVPAFSTFFRAEVAEYFADNGINVHPSDFFAALRSDETYGPATEGLVRGQRGALWADRAADAAGSPAADAPGAALVRAVALALREHSS